ncbi:hypothetical protein ACFCVO_07320 [Agromyces sp. NPDC056379]|uniref:hypothetical protein n=1 Tax=unclassified Agromyces TaxID=2639701 RepID=UPI0035DB4007
MEARFFLEVEGLSEVIRMARPSAWWYAILGLVIVQGALVVRSIAREASEQPEDTATILGRVLFFPVVFAALSVLVLSVMYRGSRVRDRALVKAGLSPIATIQVTQNLARVLATFQRPSMEFLPYSAGQLARWRTTLVDDQASLHLFDGTSSPESVLEIQWRTVHRVYTAALSDGHGSRAFHGIVVEVRDERGSTLIELMLVGKGPGGAFPMGKRFADDLCRTLQAKILLKDEVPPEEHAR